MWKRKVTQDVFFKIHFVIFQKVSTWKKHVTGRKHTDVSSWYNWSTTNSLHHKKLNNPFYWTPSGYRFVWHLIWKWQQQSLSAWLWKVIWGSPSLWQQCGSPNPLQCIKCLANCKYMVNKYVPDAKTDSLRALLSILWCCVHACWMMVLISLRRVSWAYCFFKYYLITLSKMNCLLH